MFNSLFISGEKIDLHAPREEDYPEWASWFNSQKITRYLPQGFYPNTTELQKNFHDRETSKGRFLAMIKNKEEKLLGVVSLSDIDFQKLSCQTASVCPIIDRNAPLAALEAKALVTEHAFNRFGMLRVWGANAYPENENWYKKLEIIGYKAEGIMRNAFKKGTLESNILAISIIKQDYQKLVDRRNGSLWPGENKAMSIIKRAISENISMSNKIDEYINKIEEEHEKKLMEIEKEIKKNNNN